jgi:serine/threonine protein kinase
MRDDPPEQPDPSSLVEHVLTEQRSRWLDGEPCSVEELLRKYPRLGDNDDGMIDLIYSEYTLREELGETPDESEYFTRFPQFASALKRQFNLDQFLLGDLKSGLHGPSAAPVQIPERLGKYKVVTLLDKGGQTLVYRGVHPTLNKDVIIKVCRRANLSSRDLDNLRQEGQVLANLNHPNLVRVHDLDCDGDVLFLVMDYIPGQTLAQRFGRQRCPPQQAVAILTQAARAVAHIHQRGIVHLDICPGNIIVGADGEVHLIDFGLVRCLRWFQTSAEESSGLSGTPEFMAPEQARGDKTRIGPAADVFGLGGVLYFLLTGQAPFTGTTLAEILKKASRCDWDRSLLSSRSVPRYLARTCSRALAAEPAQRPASADEFLAGLELFRDKPHRTGQRRLMVLVSLVAVGLLVFGLIRTGIFSPAPAPPLVSNEQKISPGFLQVDVLAPNGYRPLVQMVPLQTGDQLRVKVRCPDQMHMSLFLFSSEGELRLLAQQKPGAGEYLEYPTRPDQAVRLQGPPGTELLLACGRKEGPITLAEIAPLFSAGKELARLPVSTVLRLQADKIVRVDKSRDLGPPKTVPHPQAEVWGRLEELRKGLERFDCVEGLAFSHEP